MSASLKYLYHLACQEQERRFEEKNRYNWSFNARPNQRLPEGNWRIWLILAGRGFGKTRTGAETVRFWITSGYAKRICLLGDTLQEVRNIMIEGNSGLLSVCPPEETPLYEISKNQLRWGNGAFCTAYSAHAYEKLRGPQFDAAWVDELAKFKNGQEAWDQLMLGLRLGQIPRVVITTTPKPIPLIFSLLKRDDVVVTRGSTFDNAANLSSSYLENIQTRYGHTSLGAQEIEGEMIDNQGDRLWTSEMLEAARLPPGQALPPLQRLVVAIDPAVSSGDDSDETGLIVAALTADGRGVLLDDLSGRMPALHWAQRAIEAYHLHQADCLIAEVNNGGDLVEKLIHSLDPAVAYKGVRATRGKWVRAEPIAALYSQRRVIHARSFPELEAQLKEYTPHTSSFSPDRLDALVWALTELLLQPKSYQTTFEPKVWRI